jgi:unsaturated chondroitin disaccharide hydrolase
VTIGLQRYTRTLNFCVSRTRSNLARLDGFPHSTRAGRWRTSEHGRWTAGHWVGIIWLAYLWSGDEQFKAEAYRWARRLEPRKTDTTTHDMGFLFYPSFVRGYRLTGDRYFRDAAVEAANSLTTRFHPVGGYIQAWEESEDPAHAGRAIVDTMMNLPLLLWAAEETRESRFRQIALTVADTTASQHVRSDGSTYHLVDFDPVTGTPRHRGTHQGLHDESYWTRGQAWATYGFATAARMSGRDDYRTVAERLGSFFDSHLPASTVPPWDFLAEGADQPRDAAAGAIAVDGFLDLSMSAVDPAESAIWRARALHLLDALVELCSGETALERESLLLHASADVPRNSAVDESLIYGDHYFFEALLRAERPDLVEHLL